MNLTVEAFNYSAVNLIWYLPRQPNGKITSFKISVKHARSGIVVKDVSIRVEDILTGKLPECNVSLMERFLCLKILGKLHIETACIWILCIFTKVIISYLITYSIILYTLDYSQGKIREEFQNSTVRYKKSLRELWKDLIGIAFVIGLGISR